MKASRRYLVVALFGFTLTQMYQNCGQFGNQFEVAQFGSTAMGELSGSSVDLNHPTQTKIDAPAQKNIVVNKEYVAQLFREIFQSTTAPVPDLENLISSWVYNRGGQFGFGCDPYSTWSGRDCGGSIINANTAYYTEDNTVRESFRIQLCENILGLDQGVNAVLEKIQKTSPTPNRQAVGQIYDLFYRGDPAPDIVLDSLVDFDRSLALKNETTINRWRAVILQVCESSGWQQL